MNLGILIVFISLSLTFAFPEISIVGKSALKLSRTDEDGVSMVVFTVKNSDGKSKEYVIKTKNEETDTWEFVDTTSDFHVGDVVEYKSAVIQNGMVVESKWNKATLQKQFKPGQFRSLRQTTVFRDDFNTHFNKGHYTTDVSAWGGGNGEFQVYTPEAANVHTANGYLYLKPTLTVDHHAFNEGTLYNGHMDVRGLWHTCTNNVNNGCYKSAYGNEILPPIMSGKVTTRAVIRYGRVNVRARVPKGAWLWPAIWLLPRDNHYGGWPRSGEIDLMETKGNAWTNEWGGDHGIRSMASTLHWGPDSGHNCFQKTHAEKYLNQPDGWHGWHTYSLDWNQDHLRILVDNQEVFKLNTPWNGMYNYCPFHNIEDPWRNGPHNAPFDQPFHLILNVAVGGGYFSDGQFDVPKPWHSGSPHPMRDFWEKRSSWLGTWHGDDVAMLIDYVEMIQY
ncbi:beta-1,3-glucan-binding protein-like [Saccostrea cucullata]|uniref:beta-1,3-glucan-binding protein-like n=1 Tax=Saccostrea cuccullata TaxID=36930 RepID=UPI002ED0E7BB